MSSTSGAGVTFSGPDWENLNRLVALVKFESLVNTDLQGTDNSPVPAAQCAWIAQRFRGPALDWVAASHATNATLFTSGLDSFVDQVRHGFGVAEDNLKALLQAQLDNLRMGHEVPVFFAEIDRLFIGLAVTGHDARIAHVMGKLPHSIKVSLAEQGRQFHNYDVMREWLNTRWALMPGPRAASSSGANPKKPKCTNCGKKGHLASECRKSKN